MGTGNLPFVQDFLSTSKKRCPENDPFILKIAYFTLSSSSTASSQVFHLNVLGLYPS